LIALFNLRLRYKHSNIEHAFCVLKFRCDPTRAEHSRRQSFLNLGHRSPAPPYFFPAVPDIDMVITSNNANVAPVLTGYVNPMILLYFTHPSIPFCVKRLGYGL
jgi:hypothetical protein